MWRIKQPRARNKKGELAALVLWLKKWEHILRYRRFVVRSDSKSIQSVDKVKDELRGMLFDVPPSFRALILNLNMLLARRISWPIFLAGYRVWILLLRVWKGPLPG